MKEEKNNVNNESNVKQNNGSKVIIAVLAVLLIGALGFICYDKFINKEKPPVPTLTPMPTPTSSPVPTDNINTNIIEASVGEVKSVELTNKNQTIKFGNNLLQLRVDDNYGNNEYITYKLFINDKLIEKRSYGENEHEIYVNYAFVTNKFVLFTGIYQAPYTLSYAIDANGNEIKIDDDSLYAGVKDIHYEGDSIIATTYPIGDVDYYEKTVIIKYENNSIKIVPKG